MKNKKENKSNIELNIRKRIRMQILVLASSLLLVVVLIFAMTAAWFTNVAKTGSLTFETESWGFDESKMILSQEAVSIAPEATGIVPLTVDNSSAAETVKVTVSMSKTMMETELQKRIYFYADTSKTFTLFSGEVTAEDGTTEEVSIQETVSKIYLGASAPDNYTYTILPGQVLTMSELYYNDVPLKWEWVYDMLGYYFRGTVDTDAESPVITDEYLRPIEYDYEEASFDTVEDSTAYQQLLQAEGMTTADFLVQISSEDGYPGNIDAEEAVAVTGADGVTRLYYPVQVDSTGYGIWAYLCNNSEIKAGMDYDTKLAASGEKITANATIYLTAYTVPANTESVTTEEQLQTALADEKVDVVALFADIGAENLIRCTEGSKVIDLNGYNLQYTGAETEYELFTVSEGATLTVMNGQLTGSSTAAGFTGGASIRAIQAVGGNVVLSDVKISNFDAAVAVADYTAETVGDSVVQITGSDLTGTQAALLLQGNGSASDALTRVIVQNSKLTSLYSNAITGQGSDDRWGTELILTDSELSGYYGGIYQPQQKSLTTITNCTIVANTGIILKGGTMNIYDSTIRGTGEVAAVDAAVSKSGYTDTGDGVYVEAGYAWSATLILKGKNVITSEKAYAVEMVGEAGKGPGRVLIYDGSYTGTKGDASWDGIGTFEIYGGTFTNEAVNVNITRYDNQDQQTE